MRKICLTVGYQLEDWDIDGPWDEKEAFDSGISIRGLGYGWTLG